MPNKSSGKPKRRSFGDRLSHAFFRWESAVIIALTIVLVGLSLIGVSWIPGQWWIWLALGLAVEALIVWASLSDVRDSAGETPRQASDVHALRDKKLREQVEKALEYRQRFEALVQRRGVGQEPLRLVMAGVTNWAAAVSDVARRLDGAPPQRDPMGRARLQLEDTLATLGVVHMQLQLAQAGDVAGIPQRLQGDVAEQVASLRDLAEALGRARA